MSKRSLAEAWSGASEKIISRAETLGAIARKVYEMEASDALAQALSTAKSRILRDVFRSLKLLQVQPVRLVERDGIKLTNRSLI